jgi:uncharacterized membrane protein
MYYEQKPQKEEPPGCLDVLVLTRAAFAVMLWPMLALLAAMAAVMFVIYLFLLNPVLVLIPLGFLVVAALAFSYWERRRFTPPKR